VKIDAQEFDVEAVAESLEQLIRRNIQSAPGSRWKKTGTLLNSIRAVRNEVVGGSGRLGNEHVVRMFADEILPADIDRQTRDVIAEQIHGMFTVED
jgi:hypothetical protein